MSEDMKTETRLREYPRVRRNTLAIAFIPFLSLSDRARKTSAPSCSLAQCLGRVP